LVDRRVATTAVRLVENWVGSWVNRLADWLVARMAGPTDEMTVGSSAVPMVVMTAASTADSKAELSAVRWVDSKEFPWAASTVERMVDQSAGHSVVR
jgi:hypothetical protein